MEIYRQWFTPTTDPVPSALPLVLLHEGLGSVSAWGRFPQLLADATRHRVLAFDRAGYGRNDPAPGPWPADFMTIEARRLGSLLSREGIERHVLVGHSDGATIALLYPGERRTTDPEPRAIVSISAHVSVEGVCVDAITAVRENYQSGGESSLAARLAPHHVSADEVFEAWSEVWISPRFSDWNIVEELAEVTCPVLALQGTEDVYATRGQLELIEASVSGPVTVVDVAGSDHWPHREATDVVLDAVTKFLTTAAQE